MTKLSSGNSGHFIKSTLLITLFSLLSRILGVFRSTLLNSIYGATESGGTIDCYIAAYRLPDIIFNLVAAGSISIILIPYLSGLMKNDENDGLNKACSSFLNFFFLAISFMLVITFIFADYIVSNWLVAGWTDAGNIRLTVSLSRILLLQVLFMTLSAVFGSYLNTIERFMSYSIAILSYNVGIIAGILFLSPFIGIHGVVWGAVIGSFIHFFIQMAGSVKNGFRYSIGLPRLDEELKKLLTVALPRIISISSDQLVRFVLISFASFIYTGSMIIFDNVENVGMVFYGMLAVSVSTTAFPGLVKLYNEGKYDEMFDSYMDKLRFMMFFMLPASAAMIIFKDDIVELLFHYGKFNITDRTLTSNALLIYTTGIPFISITILTVKYYYAMKKSLIPMIAALIAIAVTVAVSYFLSVKYGVSGLAAGRSCGFMVQAVLLLLFLYVMNSKLKIKGSGTGKRIRQMIFLTVISLIMLFCGLLMHYFMKFSDNVKLNSVITLIAGTSLISLIYIALCTAFKNPEIYAFIDKIRKILGMNK